MKKNLPNRHFVTIIGWGHWSWFITGIYQEVKGKGLLLAYMVSLCQLKKPPAAFQGSCAGAWLEPEDVSVVRKDAPFLGSWAARAWLA